MKAEIVIVKANGGVRCRLCSGEKFVKKGEKALKVSATSAGSPYSGQNSFFCIPHARAIQIMFVELDL